MQNNHPDKKQSESNSRDHLGKKPKKKKPIRPRIYSEAAPKRKPSENSDFKAGDRRPPNMVSPFVHVNDNPSIEPPREPEKDPGTPLLVIQLPQPQSGEKPQEIIITGETSAKEIKLVAPKRGLLRKNPSALPDDEKLKTPTKSDGDENTFTYQIPADQSKKKPVEERETAMSKHKFSWYKNNLQVNDSFPFSKQQMLMQTSWYCSRSRSA